MKKTILLLLAFITSHWAIAQYNLPQNKVWAMGRYVGIDFNGSNGPVAFPTNMQGDNDEGCASVSNEQGNLLFYTNGARIWTATGALMPHGNNFNGSGTNTASTTQSAVIVPYLSGDSRKLFYLFTLSNAGSDLKDNLYCNLVDMNLNNGLGDIDTTFSLTGMVLEDSLSEKMIAIPGCHNNIWLLTHSSQDSVFKAFEITAAGISAAPVESMTNEVIPVYYATYFQGVMKVSPQWDRILMCLNPGLVLYDFDVTTGMVSHPYRLDNGPFYGYGATFSPDGSKVYAIPQTSDSVFQYNLNAAVPSASKTAVGSIHIYASEDLKLGPDGKIYMGSGLDYGANGQMRHMARINYPNNAGAACGFQDTVSNLLLVNPAYPTASLIAGLPNEVVMPVMLGADSSRTIMDTLICTFPAGGLALPATAYNERTWNNGDTAAILYTHQSGLYWARYSTHNCDVRTDTFRVQSSLPPLSIVRNNNILSTVSAYSLYRWYKDGILISGTTSQSCAINGTGWYSVSVTGSSGCTDSAAYQVTGGAGTGIQDLHALKNNIHIYPNPATHTVSVQAPIPVHVSLFNITGQKLLTQQGQGAIDISKITGGLYFIYITDKNNTIIKVEKLVIRHQGE